MSYEKPLKFVSLLGSLRKTSFNAIVARNLASLAPTHVEISAPGSVGEIPHLQAQDFPDTIVAMGKAISAADALVIVTPETSTALILPQARLVQYRPAIVTGKAGRALAQFP